MTARHRLSVAPDIPTVDEAGLPGIHLTTWQAIWAPQGRPRPLSRSSMPQHCGARRSGAAQAAAASAQEVVPRERQTPAALGYYYKAETDKWWPIIKAAGLKTE